MISSDVNFRSDEFIALCKSHQVKELYAFGSVVSGNFTNKSDIDLIVEINEPNPVFRGKLILSLYSKIGNVFNRKVDLLTVDSIKNPFFQEHIEKELIYSHA